jgi:esterase/lipase superfamily enzyme
VLLAHSMGSWPAMEAVKEVALSQGGLSPKFRNLILASPDLDVGVFRRQIEAMGPRRPDITVFVSREDRALQLSRLLARSGPRLGAIDATAEEYRDKLKNFPKVTVFDVTELRSGDRINHSIYTASPEVVQLIGNRLIAGELDNSTEASGPFSLVEGLGSAARLIVASPVLVLDAASQR